MRAQGQVRLARRLMCAVACVSLTAAGVSALCDEQKVAEHALLVSVVLSILAVVAFCQEQQLVVLGDQTSTANGAGESELSSSLQSARGRGCRALAPSEVHIDYACGLGRGNYGCVYRGTLGTNSQYVAIKTLPSNSSVGVKERQDLLEEIDIMRKLHRDGGHPNVLGFEGFCLGRQPALALEYAEHGSLKSYLEQMKESVAAVDLDLGTVFALHICRGMGFIASVGMVHRDLAARNVLVFPGNVLKITDFGLTRIVRGALFVPRFLAGNKYVANTRRKSNPTAFRWTSLEGLLEDEFTIEGDVWSFGIVITEICSLGEIPYPQFKHFDEDFVDYVQSGGRIGKGSDWPQELYGIACTCWDENPRHRPSFASLADQLQQLRTDIKGSD